MGTRAGLVNTSKGGANAASLGNSSPLPSAKKKHPTMFRDRLTSHSIEDDSRRQAELFYLQKQIQMQTQMVLLLEDGEKIEGCIEWYDRHCLKIRGHGKTLVYKSAVKYMYKLVDVEAGTKGPKDQGDRARV